VVVAKPRVNPRNSVLPPKPPAPTTSPPATPGQPAGKHPRRSGHRG
jgi:hypothetical protein